MLFVEPSAHLVDQADEVLHPSIQALGIRAGCHDRLKLRFQTAELGDRPFPKRPFLDRLSLGPLGSATRLSSLDQVLRTWVLVQQRRRRRVPLGLGGGSGGSCPKLTNLCL